MQFPAFVYKAKGPHQRAGGTYDYKLVEDAAEHAAALADGWFATLPDAIQGKPEEKPEEKAEDAAPTRAELEQKAKELGVKYDGRWSDKRLLVAVEAAMRSPC